MTGGDGGIDLAIVGAGAAGLMAAITAGRRLAGTPRRIVALDGAKRIGAKILVAGGGRCNVTHDVVDARLYAGSTTAAIRKVLGRFDVADTIDFFAHLGVELKREPTGKLFPTTDRARTVLDALLLAATQARVELVHPWRVETIERCDNGFELRTPDGEWLRARRVVLATGGRSLPRSGSDGHGFVLARALGHTITRDVFPALVPLLVGPEDPAQLRELTGVSAQAGLEVRSATGKRMTRLSGSTLCTHFGLSGPGPMNVSRHLTAARIADPAASLVVNWLDDARTETIDRELLDLGSRSVGRYLGERSRAQANGDGLPERLAAAICVSAGVEPRTPGHALRREQRRALATAATEMPVPISGDRGWNAAEVTAGGVPLAELDLRTMASRICPELYLCGEICDVDGRIGGYNFQWAWASGAVAGTAATEALRE